MELLSVPEFLEWAGGVGVGFDDRYPDARHLTLILACDHRRFWALPDYFTAWPNFIASLLDGLDPWSTLTVWPRSQRWPHSRTAEDIDERVRDVMFRGAGIPVGWPGAVRFEKRELDSVLGIVFVTFTFGWCSLDDLCLVPDHGRQLIHTDHHDVAHVGCRDEARVQTFVAHMNARGYPLPVAPPDATFRWPEWMGPEPDGWRGEDEGTA